jgi:hypothetical protein
MWAPRTGSSDGPRRYEIRLDGRLDPRWAATFDGLSLSTGKGGTTVLRGSVTDQAALHGVLQTVRDLGLPLISVFRLDPEQPPTAITPPTGRTAP